MYRAACSAMKARLSAKAGDIRGRLLRTVAAEASERSQATKAQFDAIIAKLQEEPQVSWKYPLSLNLTPSVPNCVLSSST